MSEPFIRARDIARLFGWTVGTFYKKRAQLEARGFPQPIFGRCYDPDAVRRWRALQDPNRPREPEHRLEPQPIDFGARLRAAARRLAGKEKAA